MIRFIIAVIVIVFIFNYVNHHGLHFGGGEKAQPDAQTAQLDQDIRAGRITDPFIGNPNAENIVVEFFDYNCGYCRSVDSEVKDLADSSKVKVVFIDYPILGPSSVTAARFSLAVYNLHPDKYYEFHHSLITADGPKSPAEMQKIANDLGITEDLTAESSKPLYDEVIAGNRNLAYSVGVQGTPSFVINGAYIPSFSEVWDNLK